MKKSIYLYYIPSDQENDEDVAIVEAGSKREARKEFQKLFFPGTDEYIHHLGQEKISLYRDRGRIKILCSNPEDMKTGKERENYIFEIRKRKIYIYAICWIISILGLITANCVLSGSKTKGNGYQKGG